jgi:hypothetical protein
MLLVVKPLDKHQVKKIGHINERNKTEQVQIEIPESPKNEQPIDEEIANKENIHEESNHEEELVQIDIPEQAETIELQDIESRYEEEVLQTTAYEDETTLPSNEAQPSTAPMPTLQLPIQVEDQSQSRYFLRKRKRDEDGQRKKGIRAMIAMSITLGQISNEVVINIPYLIDPHIKQGIIKAFVTILDQEDEYPQDKACPAQEIRGIKIPRTYKEPISDTKYGEEWKAAINEEITSLVANGTWEEFIRPKGANLVSTK